MTHPIVERLASPDPEVRRAACAEAAADASAVLLLDALGAALGDRAKAVVRAASDALVELAARVEGVDAAVKRALRSDDPRLRWGAAFTSARIVPPSPILLPALTGALAFEDGDQRWAAARLLVETGRLHPEVLPLLLGLARGGERPVVRRMAAYCLRELAPDRPEAARVLVEATRDADVGVRRAAFTALAALIDPPPEAVARLCEVLAADPDPATRRIAAVALGEIGAADPERLPASAGDALRRAAGGDNPDADLARLATRALERLRTAERPGNRRPAPADR